MKVEKFNNILKHKIDEHFPTKTVHQYKDDKEWMTLEIQQLCRRKSREYMKNKKSIKFLEMQKQFLDLKLKNSKKYIEKEIEALRQSNPRQFYHRIKKIGERLGECKDSGFTVPSHAEKNLSKEEEANKIAEYFSEISREFEPINKDRLPVRVRDKIEDPNILNETISVEPFHVYEKFKTRKLKPSSVPGDIPPKLEKKCGICIACC